MQRCSLRSVQVMNWNSHRIEEAVSDCYKVSKAVAETQAVVKGHETRIKAILAAWASKLIVDRKPGQVIGFRWMSPLLNIPAIEQTLLTSHISSLKGCWLVRSRLRSTSLL